MSEDSATGVDALWHGRDIVKKRWGGYEVIVDKPRHKIKYLYIKPNTRLSDQRHFYRNEHWFILQGELEVVINQMTRVKLGFGESMDIPVDTWHWPQNNSDQVCIVLEIQTGKECVEDDIERRAY